MIYGLFVALIATGLGILVYGILTGPELPVSHQPLYLADREDETREIVRAR